MNLLRRGQETPARAHWVKPWQPMRIEDAQGKIPQPSPKWIDFCALK
jgi:hypothetical protein